MLPEYDSALIDSDDDVGLYDEIQPSETYRLDFTGLPSHGRIDGIEAIKQSLMMRLRTEMSEYPWHSESYGSELHRVYELNSDETSIATHVEDVIRQDDRVTDVISVQTEKSGDVLILTCEVETVEGFTDFEMEVI